MDNHIGQGRSEEQESYSLGIGAICLEIIFGLIAAGLFWYAIFGSFPQ